MCISILPLLIKAGSSFSKWFVVNTTILSCPQVDQIPSMKFKSPESVTELSSLSCSPFLSIEFLFFLILLPVRSTEQSMSSITTMDLLDVAVRSFLNSELFFIAVSSRS
ncbi:hypothetical protein N665_1895s0001 [Sinapis alba]|nr:hypothetical protein N665_1895s0001 [Sinapis alba]